MIAYVALTLAIIFFLLLRSGILDDLPRILGLRRSPSGRKPRQLPNQQADPEEAKRLEIFKEFLEKDNDQD